MLSFPLNDILYDAEVVQLFCATRDTGIYASDDFRCTVKGSDNKVTVEAGMGWCRFDRFRGCAFALKEAQIVDLGVADENLPRIDAVGIKYDVDLNKFDVFVEKGTPNSKPIAPTIDKSLGVILCLVDRPASTSIITQDLITDVRLNKKYCGLMADAITKVDTVAIDQQITKFINDLKQGSAFIPAEEKDQFVMRAGSTMQGNLDMANNKVTGLPTPTEPTDAVPMNYFADRIIEQGVVGENGYYRKYESGIAEYWDEKTFYKNDGELYHYNGGWKPRYKGYVLKRGRYDYTHREDEPIPYRIDYPKNLFLNPPIDNFEVKNIVITDDTQSFIELGEVIKDRTTPATNLKSVGFVYKNDNFVSNFSNIVILIHTIGRWK